ncbi:MAG: RNA-binding domain-containing protein [Cyanobacteria bacterium J06642_2]
MSPLEAIAAGESQSVEFKQQIPGDRQLTKAIAALANSGGGWLILGVDDAGVVVGIADAAIETIGDCIHTASEFGVDPPLYLDIEWVWAYGKTAIAVRVPDSLHKPHYVLDANGRRAGVYVRRNAASVLAGPDMVKALKSTWGAERTPIVLGKVERGIVEYLQGQERATIKQLCKVINISQRRANRIVVELVNGGILSVFQHDRDTYYVLNRDSVRHRLAKG